MTLLETNSSIKLYFGYIKNLLCGYVCMCIWVFVCVEWHEGTESSKHSPLNSCSVTKEGIFQVTPL